MRRGLVALALLLCGALRAEAQTTSNVVGTFGRLVVGVDARTIASNGGGTPATLTLTPVRSRVEVTCNDPDGCAITLGETGIPDGLELTVINVSTNAVTLANSAGVQQLPSSASLGPWGVISFTYEGDRWVERFRNAGGATGVTTTGSPASGNLAKFSGASSITNGDLTGDVTTSGGVATTIANAAVSNAKLRNSAALSVIGRSANSSGVPADMSASAASGAVLRENGSTLGFGTVATAGLANSAVTYAKIQDVSAASRLLGRGSAAGSGSAEEITLGSGFSMAGTTLNATAGGGGGVLVESGTESKISALSADTSPTTDDLIVTVNDPGGTPANRKVTLANVLALSQSCTTITTTGSQATVDFTSINGTYTSILVTWAAQNTNSGTSADSIRLKVNNDGTAGNYTSSTRMGSQNAVSTPGAAVAATTSGSWLGDIPNSGNTNIAGTGRLLLMGYAGTTFHKSFVAENFTDSTSFLDLYHIGGRWKSTAAITRLTFGVDSGAFTDGSIFELCLQR